MDLTEKEIALGMGLAIAVGGLVGVERERKAQTDKKGSFGGIRTFPLIGLFGGLAALMAQGFGVLGLAVPFAALALLLVSAYWKQPRSSESPSLGLTSEVAALLVFALGALPFVDAVPLEFYDRLVLSAALGAVVMAALAMREPLHAVAQKMSGEDLFATVRFALLAAVMLPLLPDQTWDMFDALNPRKIGTVIVMIAAISFVGYVAVRILGQKRGIGVTAAFGGLASSTAVTLTFSDRAKQQPELARMCSFAIVLACTIMLPRLATMIALMHAPLVAHTAPVLGSMLAGCTVGALVLWRVAERKGETRAITREQTATEEKRLNNPFSLKQAFKLGAAYAIIRLAAAAAKHFFSDAGLYAAAALAGLTNVDAITISVTRMYSHDDIGSDVAALSIAIAVLSNTFVKAGIAFFIGGKRVGRFVGLVLLPSAALGILAALLT